jgi:gamma-glutamylcyclotransferase (GGCT)/AIG2-like uncharacterized protein YtfP
MSRRYFAYGSNLDLPDWHRWCREHGLREGLLQPLFTAVLPDRALAFTRRSVARGGGVLDIIPARGGWVEGVVFAVDGDGWGALERKEGAPRHYRAIDCEALSFDGAAHAVRTFEVVPGQRESHVAPHAEYLRVVRDGYRAFGIATPALDAAAAAVSPDPVRAKLFAYGTLMRGECRGAVIGEDPGDDVIPGRIPGRLFDLGEYPGWRPDPRRAAWVAGELRTGITGSLLDELDQIEEFPGFDRPGGLFRRRVVEVALAAGRSERAWVYALAVAGTYPRIESGDWRAHRLASAGRVAAAKRAAPGEPIDPG